MELNLLNSNNQKHIKIMNYDISQIFHCLTDINITKQITPFKNFFIISKNKSQNEQLSLDENFIFHYCPIGNISFVGKIKKKINEPNYKCIIIKILAVNKLLLSNEYKYYIISEFYKSVNNKTIIINKILSNRINIDYSIFFETFNKYLKVVENFITKNLKTYQYESIMLNKNINYIFNYLSSTNLFNKKNDIKVIHKKEKIEIYFTNKKSKNKISLIKISDYLSYIIIFNYTYKIMDGCKYQENSKLLIYFLKKLRKLIES